MSEEIILEKFAERFSALIKANNTDVLKLAEKLGLKSKSTIYRYMNAEMAPKISTVKYAAEFFNVNPLWLMGYDVPKEKLLPYQAIYDFSTDNEKNILNSAIVYAMQHNLDGNNISKNEYIKNLLKKLDTLNLDTAIKFIQYFVTRYKGMDFFNLADCINSLEYYKDKTDSIEDTPEIRAIARDVAKLKPEKKELFKNLLKQMSDEADEANKK